MPPGFSDGAYHDPSLGPLKFYRGFSDVVEQAEDEFGSEFDFEEFRKELQEKRQQKQFKNDKQEKLLQRRREEDRSNNKSSNTNKELED